ncbi:MAG: secondary thiamine-phosphate synthase enzyme YjbQ [Mangrovibacterium sp.]
MIQQFEIVLPKFPYGYHIITSLIEHKIGVLPNQGLCHIFVKHSSAGITINENADPSVRADFESFLNKLIPENHSCYTHIYEGTDDMPAHLKASIIGMNVTIPITDGKLNLGIWQGIYLCEFRRYADCRTLIVSVFS